jgi:hypothetical protein
LNETRFDPKKKSSQIYLYPKNLDNTLERGMHLLKEEEDALDKREIGRKFSDSRAFMAMPV